MEDDYVLALRLQEEFNREAGSSFPENQNFTDNSRDQDLAFRLQAEYDAEKNDDTEDCIIVSVKPPNKTLTNNADADLALALQLQSEWTEKDKVSSFPKSPQKQIGSGNIVDSSWELVDPCPDIHALFLQFNSAYFWGHLEGVEVRWSPRMTLCAGLCVYEGRGGLCSVRLSKPLLKLRPRKDLVETLLHEMIHAYLFVTQNNKDHDGHGPEFHKHMYRINKQTGTNISVYHSFHQEVALYKTHWWRCTGVCRDRKPFYGWVKRSMNRAPSKNDNWWEEHQRTCGGTFVKVRSPEPTQNPKTKKEQSKGKENASGSQDIRSLFSSQPKKRNFVDVDSPEKKISAQKNVNAGSRMEDIRTIFSSQPKRFQIDESSKGVDQKAKVGSASQTIRTIFTSPSKMVTNNSLLQSTHSSTPQNFPGKGFVLGKY